MPQKITVLSNQSAADAGTDALGFAFSDAVTALGRFPETRLNYFGSDIFCSPEAFRTNFLSSCRRLMAHGNASAEKLINAIKTSDAFLLGDIRGLSAAEWVPALALSRNSVAWVFSDWPREFPAGDPVWSVYRHGTFSRRLIASACMKLAYKGEPTRRDRLTPITTAIFADESLLERNSPSFPQLERAYVIPPPIDTDVFKFKPMTSARCKSWGWIGNLETDYDDAVVALRIFAFEALQNPECRFYIASELYSSEAQKILAQVRGHPALAPRVSFLNPPQNKVALAAMLRDFGVLVEPRRRRKNEFPQLVVVALACGCFPLCGRDGETEMLLRDTPEMFFPADAPSAAFLRCEKIKAFSPEMRTEMLAAYAEKLAKTAAPEVVSRKLLEVIFPEA